MYTIQMKCIQYMPYMLGILSIEHQASVYQKRYEILCSNYFSGANLDTQNFVHVQVKYTPHSSTIYYKYTML